MVATTEVTKPASKEELESFISQNKRWLPEDAEKVLRDLPAVDQKRVISAGTMSSVKNPAAVIQARVRKARELEIQLGRPAGAARGAPGAPLDGAFRGLSKPATKDELDAFVKGNERWLQGEGEKILRAMSPEDQKRIIAAGTMSGCRDPVAVLQTRAKKAREMEMEVVSMESSRQAAPKEEPPQVLPQQHVDESTAMMHILAPLEEVSRQESRFASSTGKVAEDAASIAGEDCGVGGVVEIVKAKYGCGKGQRFRVIGETSTLLQFEGGKTAPKDHENKGWRWVLREEEEAKLLAQRAAEEQRRRAEQAAKEKAAREAAKKLAEEEAAIRKALQAQAEKAKAKRKEPSFSSSSSSDDAGDAERPKPEAKKAARSSSSSSSETAIPPPKVVKRPPSDSSSSSSDSSAPPAKKAEAGKRPEKGAPAQSKAKAAKESSSSSSSSEDAELAAKKEAARKAAEEAKRKSSSSDSSSSTKVDVKTGRKRKNLDEDGGAEREAGKAKSGTVAAGDGKKRAASSKRKGPAKKGGSPPAKKGGSSSSS